MIVHVIEKRGFRGEANVTRDFERLGFLSCHNFMRGRTSAKFRILPDRRALV
jgi:hypothetical protein